MTKIVKTRIDAFKVSIIKGREKSSKIIVIVYELLGVFLIIIMAHTIFSKADITPWYFLFYTISLLRRPPLRISTTKSYYEVA